MSRNFTIRSGSGDLEPVLTPGLEPEGPPDFP
jgi:hypothetical protein